MQKIKFGKKSGVLSPLENDIMRVLWKSGDMRVREVQKKLGKNVPLTSVAVLLDRLHCKKIVSRKVSTGQGGNHYIYSPSLTQENFQKSIVEETVDKLIDAFGPAAVSYFDERFRTKKR
ncbi:MAG TPA: BlaI/MecI/CopY family transcriptional regulator [archaeon]|nr:BlaI/MecI/CopY family transcriptional regulator [archaeon]